MEAVLETCCGSPAYAAPELGRIFDNVLKKKKRLPRKFIYVRFRVFKFGRGR